jgi:NitT/TauT family transport system substrate-binding protein
LTQPQSASRAVLRMNQGDASEARIYYCAHFVAEALGYFEANDLSVAFTTTQSGGHTIQGGQIPAVLSGEADLTIGGPMVTMKNYEDGGPALVSFCAAVERNPWVLASGKQTAPLTIADLRGKRVIDVGNVGTASLCFRWLLRTNGLTEQDVDVVAGSGSQEQDFGDVASGTFDYALHSLHALAPSITDGQLLLACNLAGPTRPVPWSAYIARPEVVATRRKDFGAFTSAIGKALDWIRSQPASEVATVVASYYPDYPLAALTVAIEGYQRAEVFATSTAIAKNDFNHFAAILRQSGWLESDVPYEMLVDTSLTSQSHDAHHATEKR